MTQLERQIKSAQHRLWLDRWLRAAAFFLTVAAAIFGVAVLIHRLYDLPWPILWIATFLAAGALIASMISTIVGREDAAVAAARLDEAAGLRERLSSGQYCRSADDPFAQAVVTDAERVSQSLSARQHIRLTTPPTLGWGAMCVVLAAAMFLIPAGWLKSSEAVEAQQQSVEIEQARLAVKRQMDAVRKIAQANPVVDELISKLEGADPMAAGQLRRPSDVRHEGIKKIDALADAIKKKRNDMNYKGVTEMRKMLRGLKPPKASDAMTQQLTQSLIKGDFKTAKQEVQKLKEMLATLKSEEDKALVEKMSKQLEQLAKQLEKLAKNEQLAAKLEQAGIKKEDVERMLENLKKEDLEQLKKQLQEKGLSQQQINKLAKQLQQRQNAGAVAKKLAQSMKQSAKSAGSGQTGEAMAGLSAAADQLSELEQLEQEMNQLDAAMADMAKARENLDKPCPKCGGSGMSGGKPCSKCQGTGNRQGGGMGKLGQGRGGLAPEERTAISFKTERGKVHTGKGEIIGQFLVKGEQVKGDAPTSLAEVVTAAEHDASDRINRNRVPRQYHKAIKAYFSNVQRSIKDAKAQTPQPDGDAADESADDDAGQSGPEDGDQP